MRAWQGRYEKDRREMGATRKGAARAPGEGRGEARVRQGRARALQKNTGEKRARQGHHEAAAARGEGAERATKVST